MGNNLAIYPQNYTIDIQCKPYYCCEKKEEKPCCHEEIIDGCEGTEFGCCPDGKTPKIDEEGTNCKNICGENILSTVGILPGREPFFYNWNFIATYHFNNKSSEFTLIYDFIDSDIPEDNVIFQGQLQGTITYNGLVFDASKYINYSYKNDEKKIIFTFYQNRIPKEIIYGKNTLYMNLILKHIPLLPIKPLF